jgi:hypothetical protein
MGSVDTRLPGIGRVHPEYQYNPESGIRQREEKVYSIFEGVYANQLLDRVTRVSFHPLDMMEFIRGSGCFGRDYPRAAAHEIFGFDLYLDSVVFPLMMHLWHQPYVKGMSVSKVRTRE